MNRLVLAGLAALTWVYCGPVFAVMDDHSHPHAKPAAVQPREITIPLEFWDKLDFSFLMELEGFVAESDGDNEGDVTLATIETLIDADVSDGIKAHLGLLWEEDVTEDNILDEGYLTFGASESIPFYLKGGKLYLPFGNLQSVFISDPLTLELAEIRESAVLTGYGNPWAGLTVGAFNGDFEKDGDDNTIDDVFASVTFMPCEGLMLGAYWLSDLLDTDGFETFATTLGTDYESCDGAGAFLNAQVGPVTVNAEIVGAVELVETPGDDLRPMAYNLEASMPMCETVSVGIKFEGSDDFYGDIGTEKWADEQYGFVVSYAANEHLTLSGEVLHAEGLDDGNSRDQATVQITLVL